MQFKKFHKCGTPCRPWGSMAYLTSRCQHKCAHCYEDYSHGTITDMPDEILDLYLEKAAYAGLLGNVTLIGGEPFINPKRLINVIRKIWKIGAPTYEIFIPTNGRWVAQQNWKRIAGELMSLGQWFPYDLRIAFSQNEWNLAQLGDLAGTVLGRWQELEKCAPAIFSHRILDKDQLLPLGRAAQNQLALPDKTTGVNCSFDDWYDPGQRGGFCTDYLSVYPDGSCGICYVYDSPIIGNIHDDWKHLLAMRRDYLIALRQFLTGRDFGDLDANACLRCKEIFPIWLDSYKRSH